MLTLSEKAALLGFSGISFDGVSHSMASKILGRAMAASSLAVVLLPVLKTLGFYRRVA